MDLDSLDLESRLNKHVTYWNEFNEIQSKIEDLSETIEDETNNESERTSFKNRFYAISGQTKKYFKKASLASLPTASIHSTPSGSNSNGNENYGNRGNLFQPSSRFELPKLQTPTFHGSYDTWLNFYNSFKSMCHDNDEIPTIHKFYYLKACLKGE